MTTIDITAVAAACEKATPGPWRAIPGKFDGNGSGHVITASDPDWRDSPILISHYYYEKDDADLAFIALARTALPECIAEIERLRALVEEACDMAMQFDNHGAQPGERARVMEILDAAKGTP